MPSFGQTTIATLGRTIQASADGRPEWKEGGITIDWTAVTAVSVDTTLSDGRIVKAGDKYILFATVMCKVTGAGQGNTVGKYCPYLSTATDGRQTLTRGSCYLLNQTVLLSDLHSDHTPVFYGGLVWGERIAAIAANPAFATLAAVLTRLQNADN